MEKLCDKSWYVNELLTDNVNVVCSVFTAGLKLGLIVQCFCNLKLLLNVLEMKYLNS